MKSIADQPPSLVHRLSPLIGDSDDVIYHGLAPLLHAQSHDPDLHAEARSRALWELMHRNLLGQLLAAFDQFGLRVVVMKGTALAYDLYPEPALRPRGDSDILVHAADLDRARSVLADCGFQSYFDAQSSADDGRTQEPWSIVGPGGESHDIDLHWTALNGPTLGGIIPVDEAMAEAVPLPRLGAKAKALTRPMALLHSCIHRAQHVHSPYFVGDLAHYGGDRLIWLVDIDFLARALTESEWGLFAQRAVARGVAATCRGALLRAMDVLGTKVPVSVMAILDAAPVGAADFYLQAPTARSRAARDLRVGGWRYGLYRLFPPPELVRARYPGTGQPLAWLYLRRMADFLTGRRL